jgi:hypothetical protein
MNPGLGPKLAPSGVSADYTHRSLAFHKISSAIVCCSRATTAARLVADALISPKRSFLVGKLNCSGGDEDV